MIVCVCHRINDHAIHECARLGMGFEAMQSELGLSMRCGKCAEAAHAVWLECRQALDPKLCQDCPAAAPKLSPDGS